jgi:hypothetical protein
MRHLLYLVPVAMHASLLMHKSYPSNGPLFTFACECRSRGREPLRHCGIGHINILVFFLSVLP